MRTTGALVSVLFGFVLIPACSGADPGPTGPAEPAPGASTEASLVGVEPGMKIHWQKGVVPPAAPETEVSHTRHIRGGSSNLVDHGGNVLSTSHTYAIWWGSGFPSDAESGLDALFGGMNGSSLYGVSAQYMRGASESTSFVTNWTDSSSPPSGAPATSTIVNEACSAITANGATPDPNAIYFVFASNFPSHVSYCAWHSWGTCGGTEIQVAYMPNTTGVAGCDPGDLYGCNSYSQGTRSLANVTSHEFMEAVTDPDGSAWYDSAGSEIGDKCAWQFASCVKIGSGSWQLQEEWSNAVSGCVQD